MPVAGSTGAALLLRNLRPASPPLDILYPGCAPRQPAVCLTGQLLHTTPHTTAPHHTASHRTAPHHTSQYPSSTPCASPLPSPLPLQSFLTSEGALAEVVALLLEGDSAAQDAAVHTAWLLVKGNKGALHPDAEALGVAGEKLIGPLTAIIEAGQAKDKVGWGGGGGLRAVLGGWRSEAVKAMQCMVLLLGHSVLRCACAVTVLHMVVKHGLV